MKSSDSFDSRPLPKTFVLELTKRCNNRCLYCYAVDGSGDWTSGQYSGNEMSTGEITDMLSKLCDEAPVENIALSGGEPLLRSDVADILTFIKDRGIAPILITNGTLLTPERVSETSPGVTYEVPLLSHRRDVHDQLAGRRGVWDCVVDGMANIRQIRESMVAVFVATKLNYRDLQKTAELAIALGAQGLMFNRMNLGAYNIRYADQLLMTPEMIRESLDILEDLGIKYGIPIAVSVVIEPCMVDIQQYKHIHFGWCPLASEDSYFTIDPMGNVRICNHSPVILGNLKQDSFKDIYYAHPYVRSFYEVWPDECVGCKPEWKQVCRGGCRAASEQCYGTPARIDPAVMLSRSSYR